MEFHNRPNQCVWISRSVAVLAIPFFRCASEIFVPLGRRSATCPTEAGKYGLPAGYLDWDESASEAMIREVWEELGLNLPQRGKPIWGSLEQPYYVFSDPEGDAAQNVTLRFRFAYYCDELPFLKYSDESEEPLWFSLVDAIDEPLAFNHAAILEECYRDFTQFTRDQK